MEKVSGSEYIKGYKNEAVAPDGTIIIRKCSTTPYTFALIRNIKGSPYHKDGWILIGMSATKDGAFRLSRYSKNIDHLVVRVTVTPVIAKYR